MTARTDWGALPTKPATTQAAKAADQHYKLHGAPSKLTDRQMATVRSKITDAGMQSPIDLTGVKPIDLGVEKA